MNFRRFATLLSATLAITVSPLSVANADSTYKITLAGGSVGGAWSAIGTAIGETIKTAYPDLPSPMSLGVRRATSC
ncbi:hypothetical protein [Orrella marina]|uniref:hypothetical protein n=1 Tax=Orrella marina TaxID=2163011 RepID=UPI00131F2580|nr:hypothetical protein [Orrella marina]